jgi:hypothetical protein
VRFLGLTADEAGVVFAGLCGNFVFQSLSLRLLFLSCGLLGVLLLKRVKRQRIGVNLKSFLYWHGLNFKVSSSFPAFEERFYLS